ncbi:uncharacterized protein KGF55_003756 [Candida pseudojiufengensis]|uniref:uncharacterized protein n=1 Tax=Candida pseudojiufengensis TaxID=497109 RepID=UPI002224DEFA|nr:uncharacterized protein KGF55_003756 [Candida pseudojiufengensis]KAI5962680.1 hypothetical protein KGF55_003756 [Candida pseudojiufengensis]
MFKKHQELQDIQDNHQLNRTKYKRRDIIQDIEIDPFYPSYSSTFLSSYKLQQQPQKENLKQSKSSDSLLFFKTSSNHNYTHTNNNKRRQDNNIEGHLSIRQSISTFLQSMGQQISKNDKQFKNQNHQELINSEIASSTNSSLQNNYQANNKLNIHNILSKSQSKCENNTSPKQQREDSIIRDDLSLVPISSPPDEPVTSSNQPHFSSQFYLSPITSNESYNYYSDDASMIDPYPQHHHPYSHHNLHTEIHTQNHSLQKLDQPLLPDISPASSYSDDDNQNNNNNDNMDIEMKDPTDSRKSSTQLHQFQIQPSPLLNLPIELLMKILEYVYTDNDISSINSNLENFANTIPLLSKKFHQLSLCFIYKYTIFNRPHSFDKFLYNLEINPIIGKYVEFMDFQQFTSIGLGRTGRMNQEIQMVTSKTITHALTMTPNLIEFLASENIQDDIDVNVLDLLFNKMKKLKVIDLCGASSTELSIAFNELNLNNENKSITKLSLHDCSNLSSNILEKILINLPNLKRLDLTHTQINSSTLLKLSTNIRLTHLNLSKCSKLTTKDLINFLTNHPAIKHGSLQWLNLQIDSNVISPLSDVYLLYTLKHLNAPNLKYLNIGGMPINSRILFTIKEKFPQLVSLNISHANITLDELNEFMINNKNIEYLDLTNIKSLNKNLKTFLKLNFNSNLKSIEFDYKSLYDYTSNGEYFKILNDYGGGELIIQDSSKLIPQIWKFYDNEGRRSWIYKISESELKKANKGNLVYYDLETGNKIITKIKKPNFLKFVSRKINCSIGYYNLNSYKQKENDDEDIWPVEFSQRGIYNYYSLNVK